MEWILEHLQLIIVVAGSIAVWLNNRQREKQGLPTDYDEDGVPDSNHPGARPEVRELVPASRDGTDPEQEDRVRRIQEEIRRKIAERRGQGPLLPPPPALEPRPLEDRLGDPFRPVFQETPPPAPVPVAPSEPKTVEVMVYADEAALARQRALEEQLRQLAERRREALQLASAGSRDAGWLAGSMPSRNPCPVDKSAGSAGLAEEFRDPRALRRAMVWREVLGEPVGLR